MGLVLGRFRKKKTTLDALESIDKEIKSIEEFRRNTEQTHKRIVGRFVIISVGFYLVTACMFYFYYFPANFYDQLFYVIPLILAPVIILLVKRILTWYYQRKIARKQNKLVNLRNQKKEMLEKVMETETYKVAKMILDKFAPPEQNNKRIEIVKPMKSTPEVPNIGLRQRAISPNQQQILQQIPIRPSPMINRPPATILKPTENVPLKALPPPTPVAGTPMPMPRAILPRERTFFDKMVDYLVGDGPSNRYALICKNCFSHNGMAFRDEVEYFSFRCCYCYTLNPALKKRPLAPKFEYKLQAPSEDQSDSESEKNSPSDTDSESDEGVVVLKSAQEVAKSQDEPAIEKENLVVEEEEEEKCVNFDVDPKNADEEKSKIQEVKYHENEITTEEASPSEIKD